MFKFLKEKLKKAVNIFSKKVEEEVVEEPVEEVKEEVKKEKPKKEEKVKKKVDEVKEEPVKKKEEPKIEKPTEVEEEKVEPKVVEEPKEEIKEEEPVEEISIPMSRDEAFELLKKHNKDELDFNHFLETEAIMKALAKKLGEDEDIWGMIGLLHDVDWGLTKNNTKEHLTKAPEILKKAGFNNAFIDVVLSHGYGFDCAGLENKKRTKKVEHALACSETVTGLIHAYAILRGSIDGMKAKGLSKRFKEKRFAASVRRGIIEECKELGLETNEFFDIAIKAVAEIADEVGLGKKEEPKEPVEEKVEEVKEEKEEVIEEEKPEEPEKKGFFQRIFHKKEEPEVEEKPVEEEKVEEIKKEAPEKVEPKKEEVKEEPVEEKVEEVKEEKEEVIEEEKPEEPEKKGFFQRVGETFTKVSISEKKFDELFWDLEVVMLENNVAVEVIEKIKEDMKEKLTKDKISRGDVNQIIISSLKNSIEDLFDVEKVDLLKEIKKKKPYVIIFVGVNGSGKTTNMAKFTDLCLKNNLKPVMAACDTFRAAAIQQIEEHANNLNVKLIKHDYGADAAAVAFDAIEHAKAKNFDVVLIDTAGRSDSNINLMDELKKVIRVSKPDFTIFVGDSLTGNDAVEQAKAFNEAVGIDGIILSKTDVDEKGGAFISVSYVTGKPILYVGTGQTYADIKEFDSKIVIDNLGLD